jgi:hypothetical protein
MRETKIAPLPIGLVDGGLIGHSCELRPLSLRADRAIMQVTFDLTQGRSGTDASYARPHSGPIGHPYEFRPVEPQGRSGLDASCVRSNPDEI